MQRACKQPRSASNHQKQVGCTGGGSNFAGLANPFIREKLAGRMNPTIRAVEPAACPSLTRGRYQYDYGDAAGAPLMRA